jgi:hypothetical protein
MAVTVPMTLRNARTRRRRHLPLGLDPGAARVRRSAMLPFRRKTDQVYSTLQQVQRRISEQTGAPAPAPVRPPPAIRSPLPVPPARPPGRTTSQDLPTPAPMPLTPTPVAPMLSSPAPAGTVTLSVQTAGLAVLGLLVAGIAVGVLVMYLFQQPARRSDQAPQPVLGDHAPPPARPRMVMVLRSEPATAKAHASAGKTVDSLNAWIVKLPGSHRPMFAARQTTSGQVQIVYGAEGLERTPALQQLADLFARPQAKGGLNVTPTWEAAP